MLSATEISSVLKQSVVDGEALCVVSLMEAGGRPATGVLRLLVKEGGASAGGSLGDRALDEIAARHAVALMKDELQEIAVAVLSELAEDEKRTGDARSDHTGSSRMLRPAVCKRKLACPT